jgi:predicted nucleic acid-binding protein
VERQKKIVILDASVITKWFVEEEYTKEALRIREDYGDGTLDLRAPHLMPFEVLNALRYNPELGQRDIELAGKALSKFNIALYPLLEDLRDQCVTTALLQGLTIYDASYLALSRPLGKELYTADE